MGSACASNRANVAMFVVAAIFVPPAFADHVVIVGNHNVRGGEATDDRPFQKNDICKSIRAAEKLGHTVQLFIPGLTCSGRVYPGRCSDNGCSSGKLRELFGELAEKMPFGGKENLLIQTIGHGGRANPMSFSKNGPEYNTLYIEANPSKEITAVEFAAILKGSGIVAKAGRIRGVISQCYGGGWHELSRLIGPPGKFCSFSQTRHDLAAVNTVDETDKLRGSAFAEGFWEGQLLAKGRASLADGGLSAGLRMREITAADPNTTAWRTSSIYATEKATNTGPFYKRKYGEDFLKTLKPPYAYFGDGMDTEQGNPVLGSFMDAARNVETEAQAIRGRYRKHVSDVNSFNKDKWFWQDSKQVENSYLLRAAQCPAPVQAGIDKGIRTLLASVSTIQSNLDRQDLGKNENDIRTALVAMRARLEKNRPAAHAEVLAYAKRQNELMDRSGELMRLLRTKGITSAQYKKYQAEYDSLETAFRDQDSLRKFPALRELVLLSKEANGLERIIELLKRPDAAAYRDQVLGAWACENTPIFSGATGSGAI